MTVSALHDDLRISLTSARSVAEACEKTVDVLVAHGFSMSLVYLERGGRLRCHAVRGYWQTFEGMPPGTGIIGKTFATRQPVILDDVTSADDYVAASPRVKSEICTPILMDGTVVGVLNVESLTPFPPGSAELLGGAASELGRSIGRLGGPPGESPAQRLVRHTSAMTAHLTADEVITTALEAATDLSGFSSAAALIPQPDSLLVHQSIGPLAGAIAGLDLEALRLLTSRALFGTSSHTMGGPGEDIEGYDELARIGAASAICVSLNSGGEFSGMLLLIDERNLRPATSTIELLELLGTQAAVCLRGVRMLATLREQATLDPLTGLGHHATFTKNLTQRVQPHRSAVYAIDVDQFKAVNDTFGHQAGDRLLVAIAEALASELRECDSLYRIGGDEFAAMVEVRDAAEAMRIGRRLVNRARAVGHTVSIGVAVTAPGESGEAVLHRADTALYQVKNHGRDDVRLCSQPIPEEPPA
jgi:diguanylate cyclase (GGDEF)-like protein